MTPRKRFLFCLLLLVVFTGNLLQAAEPFAKERFRERKSARWQIMADRLSYSEKEGLYVAEGNVVITSGQEVLSAQKATYNEKTGIAEVSGDVTLEVDGDVLKGEQAVFDLKGYTGEVTKGRLFLRQNHFTIHSDHMEKTGPDLYRATGCRITTCDGEVPDWSITGSEVDVTIEGYGVVKDAVFRIRDFPSFYLPYAIFPAKTKRQSGVLIPGFGNSNLNGVEVEIPIYWAIADQMDATFYERYMTERGLMQGLEYRYVAEKESKGAFLLDILKDKITEKNLDDPTQLAVSPFPRTNEVRYWGRGRTDQELPWGVKTQLDLDYVSDQDYLREFQPGLFRYRPDLVHEYGRPQDEIMSPYRRSALRLERDGKEYSLQGLASYYELTENPDLRKASPGFGGADLSILPRPLLGSPLFFAFQTNYNYLWREEGVKGQGVFLAPAISYPLWLGRYLEFEPSFAYGRSSQWVDDQISGNDSQSRDFYDFQTRLTTNFERVFDIQWGDAKRLRHKISPSLVYNYREYRNRDRYLPLFESLEQDGKFNQLAFSLDNLFDVRKESEKGEVTYGQWGRINLIQGYNIDEPTGTLVPPERKRDFLPLLGFFSFSPTYPFTFQAEVEWDYYEKNIPYADVALELSVKRAGEKYDRFSVYYQYLKDGNKGFNFNCHINLLYGFSVGTSQWRDLRLGGSVQQRYYLEYESQCWGVRVMTEELSGLKSFSVIFRLMGFGDLRAF